MGFFSNLFKKKPEPTQNMSYATQSNPYQSSKLFSSASTPTNFYNASKSGQGNSFLQSKIGSTAPNQSVARPQAKPSYQKITPSSGQGTSNAINASMTPEERARRAAQVRQAPQTSAPRVTPPPTNTVNNAAPGGTSMADYFKQQQSNIDASAARRKTTATNQTDAFNNQIRGSYDRANESLTSQIPFLQGQSDASKAELLAAAEDIRKSGVIQKDATEEVYGDALRQGAQTGRDQELKMKNLFASLGTVDSSQFNESMINTNEETTRGQQQTLRAKARELSSIEATVQEAERKAQLTIQQEVANFNETIRKINETVGMNDQAKEEEIRIAYAGLEAVLTDIEDTIASNQTTLEQAKMTFQLDQQKLAEAEPGYGLSDSFKLDGVPTTTEEEYIVRQADDAAWNIANGYGDLNDIEDPTLKSVVQRILAEQGISAPGQGGDLNAKQSLAKAALTTLDEVDYYIANTDQHKKLLGGNVNPLNPDKRQYDYIANLMAEDIGRLQTGAVINEEEMKNFKKMLPTAWDSQEVAQQKLQTLRRNLEVKMGQA